MNTLQGKILTASEMRAERDYEPGKDWDEPMLNVFTRKDGTIRHFWGSEMAFAPPAQAALSACALSDFGLACQKLSELGYTSRGRKGAITPKGGAAPGRRPQRQDDRLHLSRV